MTKDLTEGKVSKVTLAFSLPLLISSAVQQFYNMADSAIVGKFDSSQGLAAIGGAYPITLFVIGICTGAGMGCSVLISTLFGKKQMHELKKAVSTALITFGILGVIVSLVGTLMAGSFMHWLGVNDEVFGGARAYLSIYCIGAFPMLLYNAVSATFTGMGDSRKPLYFLIGSSVLNIILDVIAVALLHLGVIGAAWATVISQIAVAVVALIAQFHRLKKLNIHSEDDLVFSKDSFLSLVQIAVPCILQQLTVSIAMVLIQGIVNTFGTAVMAGYEIGGKIINFIYGCFNAMATGLMSFVGQNYGAGKYDRCREGLKVTAIVCIIFASILTVIVIFAAENIIGIFVNSSEENINQVIHVGALYLRIVMPEQILASYVLSVGGLMRGSGSIKTFVAATVTDLGLRVIACYVLTRMLNSYTGLYWAWYVGMAVDLVICTIWYIRACRSPKGKLYISGE